MELLDLFDTDRQRSVPVAVHPAGSPEVGSILFSVGFGGGRQGYAYLARAWAQLGFRVVVVEHVGSNLSVLQQLQTQLVGLKGSAQRQRLAELVGEKGRDPLERAHRPQDLLYVREALLGSSPWVGLAGHSYGSYTALAASSMADFRGQVLMSMQPPRLPGEAERLAAVEIPTFMLTGTRDSGMPAGVDWEDRLEAFYGLPAGLGYLAVLDGADHMAFADVGLNLRPILETVISLTSEFWRALPLEQQPQWPGKMPVGVRLEHK
jgi:pimeloyl-ACP methyl ester carboxylesterase